MFKAGKIEGVIIRNLTKFVDDRGWLTETWRQDELDAHHLPVMGYISITNVDVARGPHEHADQHDNFAFIGPSNFKIYMWDNRKDSPTFMVRQILYAGEDAPKSVLIPPGVVHAYKNVGGKQGMVVNSPNRLFAGVGKKEPVDEMRYEGDPHSIFKLD
jgi:dTDP-4-dehydrorhamnose 3,5-epimerase